MSESNGRKPEELAYLLWEQQGRPENSSAENVLEAESLGQSLSAPLRMIRGENEIDLRMRGLGPLTQSEPSANPTAGAESKEALGARRGTDSTAGNAGLITSWIAGIVLAIGLGVLFLRLRKIASKFVS